MADPDVDLTNLAIVRGGCCGGDAEVMQSPGGPDYNRIRDRLSTEGLSEQQVQVVWSQLSNNKPITLPHPVAGAHRMVRWMGTVMRTFRSRYPNLRLVLWPYRRQPETATPIVGGGRLLAHEARARKVTPQDSQTA